MSNVLETDSRAIMVQITYHNAERGVPCQEKSLRVQGLA